MKFLSAVLLLVLVISNVSSASLIDDFLASAKSLWPISKGLGYNELKQLPIINFELPTENEDFLKEGLTLIDAPREALDLCTHRVIATLKKNCNQLGAEETGKLAVMMLNCQLETEGRQTYPCKPEMTLQQCTIGMDSEIHKIYSYMAHRAIGICSALKHDQFRAMTEITVNRLMQAAQSQITAMHEALKNQRRLNEMEIENMREFNENGGKIKESQLESLDKLKHAGSLIEENLVTLQQELEMRQKSEVKLNEIEKTTDEISNKLSRHTTDLQEGHEKLLKDVDSIASSLQRSNIELIHQYNQTMEFLNSFKSLMVVLSNLANNVKSFAEKILNTVHEAGFDLSDEFIVFMFFNLAYFTSAMIFMLFVDVKGLCKLVLVGLFVFNAVSAHYKAEISLLPVNIFVWICFVVFKAMTALKQRLNKMTFKLPNFFKARKVATKDDSDDDSDDEMLHDRSPTPIPYQYSSLNNKNTSAPLITLTPVRQQTVKQEFSQRYVPISPLAALSGPTRRLTISKDDSEINSIFSAGNGSNSSSSSRPDTPVTLNRPMTPDMRRVLRDTLPIQDRSGTPFSPGMSGRIQCQGITAKGQQCKNAAVPVTNRCRLHSH